MILKTLQEWEYEQQRLAKVNRKKSVMTQDQVMGIVRWAIPFIGGMAVGKGWLTTAQVGELTNVVLALVGPVMAAGGVIWSIKANSKSSIIQSASAMPEVKSMTITDPALAEAAKKPEDSARVLLKDEDGSK
jgi:hypothetical protein